MSDDRPTASSPHKSRPVHTERIGSVSASIWSNAATAGRTFYSVTFERTYRGEGDERKQASSFNHDDPNRPKLLAAHTNDMPAWGACDAIAELFEQKATVDPSMGATHYFAHELVSPPWGPGHPAWETTIVIGRHTFGRAA